MKRIIFILMMLLSISSMFAQTTTISGFVKTKTVVPNYSNGTVDVINETLTQWNLTYDGENIPIKLEVINKGKLYYYDFHNEDVEVLIFKNFRTNEISFQIKKKGLGNTIHEYSSYSGILWIDLDRIFLFDRLWVDQYYQEEDLVKAIIY